MDTLAPLPMLEYEIVRYRGHWRVLHIGKHSAPYDNQGAAIAAAVSLASNPWLKADWRASG